MRASRPKYLPCLCAVLLVAGFLVRPAHAENTSMGKDEGAENRAYWTVSFLGGLLTPRKEMRATHDQSLLAGGRFGWTGSHGAGLDITADYSPLPRDDVAELESFETHFLVATVAPRFTLRWKKLRLWGSVGGGFALERTTEFDRETKVATDTDYSSAAVGSAGLELHLLSSGGLAVVGSYARVFSSLGIETVKYEFVNLTGGLVFAFQ